MGNVIVKFDCVGFWELDEIQEVIERQFGFSPELAAENGRVFILSGSHTLNKIEKEWLQEYLDAHPQKSNEERIVELEVAELARREELLARVRKGTDAVLALAELAGVDIKQKKLKKE